VSEVLRRAALAWLAFAAAVPLRAETRFVESRLIFGHDLLHAEVRDVDLDSRADLLIALRDGGSRRLQLHRQRPDGSFASEADWTLAVPPEVVACALLDVRDGKELELLLLIPDGVLSLSFDKQGLAGNARVELRTPVFPELADPDRLWIWPWVLDIDLDGSEELLLPTEAGLVVYGRAAGEDPSVAPSLVREQLVPALFAPEEQADVPRLIGNRGDEDLKIDRRALTLFPFAPSSLPPPGRVIVLLRDSSPPLLSRTRNWTLPHLGFWNADERPDAVLVADERLFVRLQRDDGSFADAIELEQPERGDDEERDYRLIDFDGDGRSELVRITHDARGIEKEFEVVVLAIGDDSRPIEEAKAALRFKASDAEFSFRDVDRDSYVDLVVRSAILPTGISALAAVKLDVVLEVYRGGPGGALSRRPDARFVRTYTPDKLARLGEVEIFHISGDYDGDGLEDLLYLDPEGLLQIRSLRRSGDGIAFAAEPTVPPYRPPEPLRSCWAHIFNDDEVADLCLRFERGLITLVSVEDAR
jgi:hypothetical protein